MEGCSVMWRLLFHISIWNWIKRKIAAEVEEQDDAFVIHLKSSCFSPFTAVGFTDVDATLEIIFSI